MQILPSGHEPAAPEPSGLALAPFRGVRYAPNRVSGLAEVTSPPYDVIAHDKEDQLIEADPHNVVRLILPRHVPGHPGSVYDDAAQTLRSWQDERILRSDPDPALYVYEQAAAGAGGAGGAGNAGGAGSAGGADGAGQVLQRGLIGALRLSPPEAGVVRPHEDVAPGPVAGRLQLMEATQANLEPIFLLHDGSEPGASSRLVDEVASGRPPLVEAVTRDQIRHRLWAITDPAELAAIAADLAPRTALIADGHHRYAAYLQLQARRRAAGNGTGPWDYGMAMLVDAAAYPPDIGAIHRVITGLPPAAAADLAKAAFTVRSLSGGPGGADGTTFGTVPGAAPSGTAALAAGLDELAAAAAKGPAFLLAGGGELSLLSDPDPAQVDRAMPPGRSARWRSLAASVLQELLIPRIWGLSDANGADANGAIRIVHNDAAQALREADETGGTAVICPSMSTWDVYDVAAGGERVPRKSTSFGPKPRTGLVIRTFAQS